MGGLLEFFVPLTLFTFSTVIFLAKNPVYGVLSFVIVVSHVVVLLIGLNLEFLAYVLAIVYIGAIVVLFLFVIMMFYIKQGKNVRYTIRGALEYYTVGVIVSFLLSVYIYYDLVNYVDYSLLILNKSFVTLLAYLLFNDLTLFTVCAALLMFVGIVGAIILTIKQPLLTRVSSAKVRYSIKEVITKKIY